MQSTGSERGLATAIGFSAVLMWALLALFTAASGKVPPFQLSAMCFAIGGCIGLTRWISVPQARAALARQPWKAWVLGVGGLFGYHFFYFTALRNAPAVEAGLIAYLWPLLIVLFSALLPGERLAWHHIAGAMLAFAGAALIVTRGESLDIDPRYTFGYLAACVCALTWSGYSVLSRRFAAVPTDVVTGFCLATAILSALCHVALEETVWPAATREWLAVAGLGLLPVGLAFYAWDHGVKRGDIQLLGVSAYAAPLLSTILLIAFGFAPLTWAVVAAAFLVTAGAALAAKDSIRRRP
ncbi:MAG: EamA family transporter [Rhodobiaceae bacterium]|nr:EamA family transporter [Rhodobiaceae bacterium]MCC0016773.1 EamA family transporter [Rhodobiaceae bacterium]MCC0042620.1 EamA family transporter [Rhodobiaceae bacterium]